MTSFVPCNSGSRISSSCTVQLQGHQDISQDDACCHLDISTIYKLEFMTWSEKSRWQIHRALTNYSTSGCGPRTQYWWNPHYWNTVPRKWGATCQQEGACRRSTEYTAVYILICANSRTCVPAASLIKPSVRTAVSWPCCSHTHRHTHRDTNTPIHWYTHIQIQTCTHIHTRTYTNTRAWFNTCTYSINAHTKLNQNEMVNTTPKIPQQPCNLPKTSWKMDLTDESHWLWKKQMLAGVMSSWYWR